MVSQVLPGFKNKCSANLPLLPLISFYFIYIFYILLCVCVRACVSPCLFQLAFVQVTDIEVYLLSQFDGIVVMMMNTL